jgi:hypothetical protein
MNLFYDIWYRKYGVRIAEHLMNPPCPKMDLLDLPKRSILHYVSTSPIVMGPDPDDFLFRNISKPINVGHITELGDEKGMPRRHAINPMGLIRHFHSKNRRFRFMKTLEISTRDPNTLVIYNYGFLQEMYRYPRSFYSEYYKWWNTQSAVWKNIAVVTATSDRENFITCRLPTVLPSLPDLRLGSSGISQHVVKIFNNPDSLMILEIYKWLGDNRKTSVLSHVPDGEMNKVNLIFIESNRWFAINLGKLNSWRIATEEELEEDPEANIKGLTPSQIQKRFLRLMMALFHARTVASPDVTDEVQRDKENTPVDIKSDITVTATDSSDNSVSVQTAPNASPVITQATSLPVINSATGAVELKQTENPPPSEVTYDPLHSDHADDTGADITHSAELDARLDEDLAELEAISRAHVGSHNDSTTSHHEDIIIDEPVTLEDGVMKVCDRLADIGRLSAAEYRRYETLSKSYRTIVSPDGKTTLDKFIDIKPKQLAIESVTTIADKQTIHDKSMLKSSLHDFDRLYVTDIMPRDVAGMVMNVQKAGIAVTGYEVEREDSVLGSYDKHKVRITPVDGTTSTMEFKLPVIKEDGTYSVNGIKYSLRKQRGD